MNPLRFIALLFALICVSTLPVLAQSDALNIIANGNVGIGEPNPKEKLQVNGRIMDKTGWVMPVGTILPFAGTAAPVGWLFCDGTAYAKNGAQKDLFDVIGTMYGVDGNDKFRLPDLRGSFVMGAVPQDPNETVAKKGEPDVHSHLVKAPAVDFTSTTNGNHNHKMPARFYDRYLATIRNGIKLDNHVYGHIDWINGIDRGPNSVKNEVTQDAGDHSHNIKVDIPQFSSGNSTGKNRPKWLALNYIIKY